MAKTKKAIKVGTIDQYFNDREANQIIESMKKVWNDIGYDYLNLVAEEGQSSIPREEVIEISMDANRMSQTTGLSKQLEERLYKAPTEIQELLGKIAFPCARYGM